MPHPSCTQQMTQLHNIELLDIFSCTVVEFIEPFCPFHVLCRYGCKHIKHLAQDSYCFCLPFIYAYITFARCVPCSAISSPPHVPTTLTAYMHSNFVCMLFRSSVYVIFRPCNLSPLGYLRICPLLLRMQARPTIPRLPPIAAT